MTNKVHTDEKKAELAVKRVNSLASTYDFLTQILDRGNFELSAVLIGKIMAQMNRLIQDLKDHSRPSAAYVDVLLDNRMSTFAQDLEHAVTLEKKADLDEPNFSASELKSITVRIGNYLNTLETAVFFIYPQKGFRKTLFDFWSSHKRSLLAVLTVLVLVEAGMALSNFWQGRKHSLMCDVFTDQNLTQRFKRTRSQQIDFDWGYGAPFLGFKVDDFSMRWTGFIQITDAGDYTFSTEADDGVVLLVDGSEVIRDWTSHAKKTNSGTVHLESGCHPLQLDYFENNSAASVRLLWKTPNQSESVVIPSSAFRSEMKYCS